MKTNFEKLPHISLHETSTDVDVSKMRAFTGHYLIDKGFEVESTHIECAGRILSSRKTQVFNLIYLSSCYNARVLVFKAIFTREYYRRFVGSVWGEIFSTCPHINSESDSVLLVQEK